VSRIIAVALGVIALAGIAHTQQDALSGFPNTRRLGKALVQYLDKAGLQVVLSYEYSQRHHDTAWLLIDFGARSEHRLVLDREHFKLVSETGEWFPIASQRHFLEGSRDITQLRQNASVSRRDVASYLGALDLREKLKFFALPGEGAIVTGALLDKDRNTLGELYFEMPAGAWARGDYALLIEHPQARVKLPISLD
jgi:hypothetical protein